MAALRSSGVVTRRPDAPGANPGLPGGRTRSCRKPPPGSGGSESRCWSGPASACRRQAPPCSAPAAARECFRSPPGPGKRRRPAAGLSRSRSPTKRRPAMAAAARAQGHRRRPAREKRAALPPLYLLPAALGPHQRTQATSPTAARSGAVHSASNPRPICCLASLHRRARRSLSLSLAARRQCSAARCSAQPILARYAVTHLSPSPVPPPSEAPRISCIDSWGCLPRQGLQWRSSNLGCAPPNGRSEPGGGLWGQTWARRRACLAS